MTAKFYYVLSTLKAIRSRQIANDGALFAQLHSAGIEHEGIHSQDNMQPRWWELGPLDSATRWERHFQAFSLDAT